MYYDVQKRKSANLSSEWDSLTDCNCSFWNKKDCEAADLSILLIQHDKKHWTVCDQLSHLSINEAFSRLIFQVTAITSHFTKIMTAYSDEFSFSA